MRLFEPLQPGSSAIYGGEDVTKSLRSSQPEAPPPSVETAPSLPAHDKKQILKATLERFRYNKALTARELGISRSKLYRMLHKYGLAD